MDSPSPFIPASRYDKIKERERVARLRRIDASLWRAEIRKGKTICTCRYCEGKYHKLTWDGIDQRLWLGEDEGCMINVMLHIHRINMIKRIHTPIHILDRLREIAK